MSSYEELALAVASSACLGAAEPPGSSVTLLISFAVTDLESFTQILLGVFVIIINQSTLGLHVVLAKQLARVARQLADNWQTTGGLRAAQKKAYFRPKKLGCTQDTYP